MRLGIYQRKISSCYDMRTKSLDRVDGPIELETCSIPGFDIYCRKTRSRMRNIIPDDLCEIPTDVEPIAIHEEARYWTIERWIEGIQQSITAPQCCDISTGIPIYVRK